MWRLPAGSSTPHAGKAVTRVHASVRHPTAVVPLGIATLPGLDAMGPPVRMRGLKRHGIANAHPRHQTRNTGLAFSIGDASGWRRPRHWVVHKGGSAVL